MRSRMDWMFPFAVKVYTVHLICIFLMLEHSDIHNSTFVNRHSSFGYCFEVDAAGNRTLSVA